MSPEFGWASKKEQNILRKVGERAISQIDSDAEEALKQRNREKAKEELVRGDKLEVSLAKLEAEYQRHSEELSKISEENPDLALAIYSIPEFLSSRLQDEEIESTVSEEESEEESGLQVSEETKLPIAKAMLYLIKKNDAGEYLYSDYRSIWRDLLPEEQKEQPRILGDATNRLAVRASNIIDNLFKAGGYVQDMRDYVESRFRWIAQKPDWKAFYEYVTETYPDYTPEQFSLEVLSRFVQPSVLEQRKQEFEEKRRQHPYIPDARAIALHALIERDSDGNFVYEPKDLAKGILQDDFKENKRALSRACMNIANAKWILKNAILADPKFTMQEFLSDFGKNLELIRNPEWKKFYQKVSTDYADWDPQAFVDQILYRNEKNDISGEDSEGKVYDAVETKLMGINPVHEITLYDALTRDTVVEQIEALLEKPIEDILIEGGWNKKGSWNNTLLASAEIAARKRKWETNKQSISWKEGLDAKESVAEFIRDLAEHRESYGEIMRLRGINGFRFLYCIAPELTKNKAERLISILFPVREHQVDEQGYLQ